MQPWLSNLVGMARGAGFAPFAVGEGEPAGATLKPYLLKTLFLVAITGLSVSPGWATGITWPTNQLMPTFSQPAPVLDCVDISSSSGPEIDLFASLQGIVNRTQPRIACVSTGDGEGEFTWLNLHNFSYKLTNGYNLILKYQSSVTGLVVTDPNQPDTLNLATTMAGVNNELICNPSLLPTLTNAPYNLPVVDDLRNRFSNKYQVYGYLYTNYWPLCTHRLMAGLETNLDGQLRDYLVAMKVATVWLDPGPGNFQDQAALAQFTSAMTPANGVYIGWWPNEGNDLPWIAQYGIPVLASDFLRNASVFGGASRTIHVPAMPPIPPLQNKVYVSFILSDGDNIQYMQHVMKIDWATAARGSIPIGWTSSPLAADVDPGMVNYFWSTATTNDCLISGPSGAGYAHIENWSIANIMAFAKVSSPYLQRAGLRVITVWDQVSSGTATLYAKYCPSLLGLTDQSGGTYTSVNQGLRTIGLTVTYSSDTNAIYSGITNAAQSWNGAAPMFLAAQAVVWSINPAMLAGIASRLDPNKYVIVRPDHLFLLYNQVYGNAVAVTRAAPNITGTTATLQGFVNPNAGTASAWFQWGTNANYNAITTITNLSGNSGLLINASLNGLSPGTVYHYNVVVSNSLGITYGADKFFTTGGNVKAWGDGSLGQTNLPAGLTNIIGVSCGANHALALRNDGSVFSWGYNAFNQTNVPSGLTGVVAVSGGFQHSLALNANGSVTAWGDNTFGQTNVPTNLTNAVTIAAGGYHSLALKNDGTVTAWGYNNSGQTNVPLGLSNVVAIAAGRYHSLALKSDGTVTAWGYNAFGQANVPLGLDHVIAIAAGDYDSLALKANGIPIANLVPAAKWVADSLTGANGSSVSSWADIVNGITATQTSTGNQPQLFSNVINGHKTVRFNGSSSQCLTIASTNSPMSGAGGFTVAVVFRTTTAGSSSSNFYLNTGLLGAEQAGVVADWALCINGSQLGAGLGAGGAGCGPDLSLYGGNVTDGNAHIAMYVHSGNTITLYVDGVIVATQSSICPEARGDYPVQIGAMAPGLYFYTGDIAEIQMYNTPLDPGQILSANEILAATYGINGAAANIVAWGSSSSGQGTVPAGLTNESAIGSGSAFNLALNSNGTVTGWGLNTSGQLNPPAGLTNVTAIFGGGTFSLAIGDQPPVSFSTNVTGYASHDLAFALPTVSLDGQPLNIRITSLPAVGTLYQYSSGARGTAITAPNTLVTDASGRVIFAPVSGNTGNPYDSFSFICDDGTYTSAVAQVNVSINLPAVPQFAGVSLISAGSQFSLNFFGSSNATYSVWASSDLVNWVDLGTATEASPGQYQYTDTAVAGLPQRFYRLSAP